MLQKITIPGLGAIKKNSGLTELSQTSDGRFTVRSEGVQAIYTTGDRKVEIVSFENQSLAFVKSSFGYPAYYPIYPTNFTKPVKAVLMDLDGTSVHSENFWIWISSRSIYICLFRFNHSSPNLFFSEKDL